MSGIRVDVEWLTRCADEVGAAGEDVLAVRRDLEAARLDAEAFGAVGRESGAVEAYERAASVLLDRLSRAGDLLVDAGGELRGVVDSHTGGDESGAGELARDGQV